MDNVCAICGKPILTDIVFCNDEDERICQECWDNG
jgi:predicted nucleic acid-binding Zn ribbon protein